MASLSAQHTARLGRAVTCLSTTLALWLAGGCGLLNGSSTQPEDTTNSHKLEKPTISLGVMQVIDTAPFYIARKKGYFAQEGLTVQVVPTLSGTDSVPLLASGKIDAGISNWATVFAAEQKKVDDYRIVADATQGRAHVMIVAARPDSGITEPKDLVGKSVSTNAINDVPELALKAILQANGVDINQVHTVVVHHPDTPAALANKVVDACVQLEPFITKAHQQSGTEAVVDLFGPGVTHDLPIAGWFTTKTFVDHNPRTAAAFQHAIQRGAADAADEQEVRQILPDYSGIDKDTAKIVTIPAFPTSLSATRLQRVADLMLTYGQLSGRLDVTSLIFTAPPS